MSAPPPYSPPHENLNSLPKHVWGPMLWQQLHDRPQITGGDMTSEREWLKAFAEAIPCRTECYPHFVAHMERYPVDFTSMETYFRWTWGAHNAVNYRRGVKRIPWQEAWGKEI